MHTLIFLAAAGKGRVWGWHWGLWRFDRSIAGNQAIQTWHCSHKGAPIHSMGPWMSESQWLSEKSEITHILTSRIRWVTMLTFQNYRIEVVSMSLNETIFTFHLQSKDWTELIEFDFKCLWHQNYICMVYGTEHYQVQYYRFDLLSRPECPVHWL